jgi:hypothetical protein
LAAFIFLMSLLIIGFMLFGFRVSSILSREEQED